MADGFDTPEGVTADLTMQGAAPQPVNRVSGKRDENDSKRWKARIKTSRDDRSQRIADWRTNVDYRRGKVFDTASDEDRIAINMDWPNTKAKQAHLFSQMPEARLSAKLKELEIVVPPFAKALNKTLKQAGVGAAMDECMSDVINMAGVCGVVAWYEQKEAMVELPTISREMVPGLSNEEWQLALDNKIIPTEKINKAFDKRFVAERIDPEHLLWPKKFKGSDFNVAPWVGRDGELTWAIAKSRFKLKEEDKSKLVSAAGGVPESGFEDRSDITGHDDTEETVKFAELFYRRHVYHADEKSYTSIHHLVFLDGMDEPVIDEPWRGQKAVAGGKYIGSCKFPIQIATLTYVSNEPIPPSDSAIGRPQVDELIEGRNQMMLQRRHSQPMRWINTSLVDPIVVDAIQRGTFQGFIPIMGDGDRALGEVARANFPAENRMFDQIAKDDLMNQWQIGSNQNSNISSGETSAAEAEIVQGNFQTRIGYERGKIGTFFVNIAEVVGGLLALYGDFESPELGQEDIQRLAQWDRKTIGNEFLYDIRKDSTVLLDTEQEIKRLVRLLDIVGQHPSVDSEILLRQLAELHGQDPDNLIKPPQPKGPEPPKFAYSFKGEDMKDPIVLGIAIANGQAPSPDQVEAAKALLLTGAGMLPGGPTGAPPPTDQAAQIPQTKGEAHPDWHGMPRVNKRRGVNEDQ